jgi:hypothetical protein
LGGEYSLLAKTAASLERGLAFRITAANQQDSTVVYKITA